MLATLLTTTPLAVPSKVPLAPAITIDDICLAWVIDNEARGESILGQRAVLDVVKNRMATKKLTACQVVKEPYQFSGYHKGMKLKATKEMLHRLDDVSKMKPVVPSATYFHAKYVRPSWAAKMKRILTIGRHIFFAERKPKEKQK